MRVVDVAKMNRILESMQGIKYLEWEKLKQAIDIYFDNAADNQKNNILMESPTIIMDIHKRLF